MDFAVCFQDKNLICLAIVLFGMLQVLVCLLRSLLGERFYRMWRYYLLSCAGAFRARDIQLWQWVFSRGGVQGVYPRQV
ncbi:hypothetical protein LH51_14500 [Nitrincola sp. A-D6]|nr:hypothetical protein LH51_14500 [Nitrincola sp. A-D6]